MKNKTRGKRQKTKKQKGKKKKRHKAKTRNKPNKQKGAQEKDENKRVCSCSDETSQGKLMIESIIPVIDCVPLRLLAIAVKRRGEANRGRALRYAPACENVS